MRLGLYSAAVARLVPRGHLTLFDLQQGMLDRARARIWRDALHNVSLTLGHAGELPFPDRSFDLLYMVGVFGEIDDQRAFLRSALRVLKPTGLLSISEHHPDPDLEPAAEVTAKAEAAGFARMRQQGMRWCYTLTFRALSATAPE